MGRARRAAATTAKVVALAALALPLMLWAVIRPAQTVGILMLGTLAWVLLRPHRHLVKAALDEHLPWRRWRRMRNEERLRKSFEEIVTREEWDLPASGQP